MRARNHLTWVEQKEFGGLWTAGESTLMPANAAQVMSGCHPQPGGGLRGFLKPTTTVVGTGLVKTYLNLTGAATSYASTPDLGTAFETGRNYIEVDLAMTDWTPAAVSVIASDYSANTGMEFRMAATTGILQFAYGSGAASVTYSATTALTNPETGGAPVNGTRLWLKVAWVSGTFCTFYVSNTGDEGDWTTIGAPVVAVAQLAVASPAAWTVGARPGGISPLAGKVYHVLTGLAKKSVGDFENQAGAATSWTSFQNETWTVISPATITSQGAVNRVAVGLAARTRVGPLGSTPLLYLATIQDPASAGDVNDWRLHYYDGAGNGDDTQVRWRDFWGRFRGQNYAGLPPRPATPAFASLGRASFAVEGLITFDYVSLSPRAAFTNFTTTGAGGGVFRLDLDGSTAVLSNWNSVIGFERSLGLVGLVEHQSRLVAGYKDRVVFTAPGSEVFYPNDPTNPGGYITVNPSGWFVLDPDHRYPEEVATEGPLVAWMVSVPPGDLLVATKDGRIYNVQGDLGDPTVRELGRWAPQVSQVPTNTPAGVFFIMQNVGVHRIGVDGAVENISPGLDPTQWGSFDPAVGLGSLAGTDRYLFAPNQSTADGTTNGPLVFDIATKAWFTATHPLQTTITSPRLMALENNPDDAGIWVVPNVTLTAGAQATVVKYRTGAGPIANGVIDEPRNSVWEYTSAPLRDPNLDQLDVRQVVIPVFAWNGGSTIEVTVDGVMVSKTLPSGRSVQTFSFRARGKVLDINILAKSNDTAVEAPMIEGYRVGYKAGPLQ